MLTPRLAIEVALENQLWRIKHAPTSSPRSDSFTAAIRPAAMSKRGEPDAAIRYRAGSSAQQRADRLAAAAERRSRSLARTLYEDAVDTYQLQFGWKES